MFTPEQELYLKNLADKGLAEQSDSDVRNAEIVLKTKIQVAREAKRAELELQAKTLVDTGLQEFETVEVPKIQ